MKQPLLDRPVGAKGLGLIPVVKRGLSACVSGLCLSWLGLSLEAQAESSPATNGAAASGAVKADMAGVPLFNFDTNQFEATDFTNISLKAGVRLTNSILQGTVQADAEGDARGWGAVDFQRIRTAAHQVASGQSSFIGGGAENVALGGDAFIGSGTGNTNATTSDGVIVGGGHNLVGNPDGFGGIDSFIGAGAYNWCNSGESAIVAGANNVADGGTDQYIGSGMYNVITNGNYNAILGGIRNAVSADGAMALGSWLTNATPYSVAIGYGGHALTVASNGAVTVRGELAVTAAYSAFANLWTTDGTATYKVANQYVVLTNYTEGLSFPPEGVNVMANDLRRGYGTNSQAGYYRLEFSCSYSSAASGKPRFELTVLTNGMDTKIRAERTAVPGLTDSVSAVGIRFLPANTSLSLAVKSDQAKPIPFTPVDVHLVVTKQ